MKILAVKFTVIEIALWTVTFLDGVDTVVRILTLVGALVAFLFQYRTLVQSNRHNKQIREMEKQIKEQELWRQLEMNKQLQHKDEAKQLPMGD